MTAVTEAHRSIPVVAELSVSVVICTYSQDRWDWLCAAVAAVQMQTRPAQEIIVVVDHNDALAARARETFADATVIANEQSPGLSGARNTGVRRSTGDVLVFLDDDAIAELPCLERLIDVYTDPAVVGAGGAARPVWAKGAPSWFPEEFNWVVGCAYTGLPESTSRVRNPIGACMSFRRSAFHLAGPFTNGMGRAGADRMGCEETEFSIRVQQHLPGSTVMYVPSARVQHHVDPGQQSWRHFVRRCYAEGRSKALVASHVGASAALASEREYTRRVLPAGALRGLRDTATGHPTGLLRTVAIGAGLAATASGYLRGRFRSSQRELRGTVLR
jgi:GT2 family glycosyltransferase